MDASTNEKPDDEQPTAAVEEQVPPAIVDECIVDTDVILADESVADADGNFPPLAE